MFCYDVGEEKVGLLVSVDVSEVGTTLDWTASWRSFVLLQEGSDCSGDCEVQIDIQLLRAGV